MNWLHRHSPGWLWDSYLGGDNLSLAGFMLSWVVPAALAIGFVYVVGGAATYAVNTRNCNTHGSQAGLDSHYDFWAEQCFIELPNGQAIAYENYRAAEAGE